MEARFSAPVFPGDTVSVALWREQPGVAAFQMRVPERDAVVLSSGRTTYGPVRLLR